MAEPQSLPETQVQVFVAQHTETRTLGCLGDPRVNVLRRNWALDSISEGRMQ
ncbi:MAG: potassium-transporting ATPase subunit C [Planctomycetes bacterium]|nr:potassium-transporting ATPase subunit C [Planctomycetota bacterium]